MKPVQDYARDLIVQELTSKLGTELGIGRLYFQPFNTVGLDSVYLYDQTQDKVLFAEKVSASIDLISLMNKDVIITSARLSNFEVNLSKETTSSPLNIQYIIDAFKTEKDSTKKSVDVKLSSVYVSNGSFRYDVKDQPKIKDKFDKNHIDVSELNARLALKSLRSDSLNLQIKKLSLKEKSGLEITNLICRLITKDQNVSFKGFRLDLPSSFLQFEKCDIDLNTNAESTNIVDNAIIDCVISPSYIAPKDVSPFVPALKNFSDIITLHATVQGSIDDIKLDNLSLHFGSKMNLVSNIEIKDVRDKDKMYLLGSIDNMTITSEGLTGLAHNFSTKEKKITVPPYVLNLGTISFTGDVSGYLNQLVAFGSFETDLGIVNTDILFELNPKKGTNFYCKGKVYTSNFELGNLLNDHKFNKVSLAINVELEKPDYGMIRGSADGKITDFAYNNYVYQTITFDTDYDGKVLDATLDLNDPNGMINLNGVLDLTNKKEPQLSISTQFDNIQLDKLKLSDKYINSYLSFNINADFKGNNIDNAVGYLSVDSLDFIYGEKRFKQNQFKVELSEQDNVKEIDIHSAILQGKVSGQYSISTLVNSILHTLHPYLPSLINEKPIAKDKEEIKNDLKFKFTAYNTTELSDILKLPVEVADSLTIRGFYNNETDKFKVDIQSPLIKSGTNQIQSAHILAENREDSINTAISLLFVNKNQIRNDINIDISAIHDQVDTHIDFANEQKGAKGSFFISSLFTRHDKKDPLSIDINILPSKLELNNEAWVMNKSHINIKQNIIDVNNFVINNKDDNQSIKINGKYAKTDPRSILKTELKNIDLEYIFQILAVDVLKFGGSATGNVFLSNVEEKPYLNTRLEVKNFKFNNTELGDLNLFSELDESTNRIRLDGKLLSKENKLTQIDGFIDPIKQGLSINFDADSINVGFLRTFTESIFSTVEGRGSGKVRLYGDFSNVTIEGKAYIEKGKIGIDFLNTVYTFSDSVYMKKDLIYFHDIKFHDQYNNEAIVSGKIAHDFFSDVMYQIDLSAQKFLVYNATQTHNPLFYGKVYGTGKGSIGGDENAIDIDVSMRTEANTSIRMNFMENVINEYSFITYKNDIEIDDTETNIPATVASAPIKTSSGMEINMNFYIDATPDATVEIVMDPIGGDLIRGTGSGAMQFKWSTKDSPRLYGTYLINRGSYTFTFQKILERKFSILDGSSVEFSGDPFQANLNVNATYKVTANLSDLDRELAQNVGQSTIPVNCVLNLTGILKHPNIKLDINFPNTNTDVERQIKSYMDTEDMVNRQIAYLLLLSKFYTADKDKSGYKSSEFAAAASATLSNQLSKIVGQIDDRWQLGTNIRTSDSELTDTEVELLLSSQLLNDRLLINGNFGYRDSKVVDRENNFIGNVDIELLLNNSGSWRIKAYNHYNERYYYTQNSELTQGVGIKYKKDFDKLNDLFNWKKKNNKTVNNKSQIVPNDSIEVINKETDNFIEIK